MTVKKRRNQMRDSIILAVIIVCIAIVILVGLRVEEEKTEKDEA